MPARGSDMHLSVDTGEGSFIKIAGLRTKAVSLTAAAIDVTHSGSSGGWRECTPGAGVKAAQFTGQGLFHNEASAEFTRAAFFEQSIHNYRVKLPDFGILSGACLLTGLSYRGTHAGEANFELSLTSAGSLSFTPTF